MAPVVLHVGIVGAGMGGLAAAIALKRAGVKVTMLEAATSLGEIGAGIQIFPNVSRYLVRWDVDEIIGDNLVNVDEVRTWGVGGRLITRVDPKRMQRITGFPHWIARRDHLHAGLTESARRHGVEIVVGARVSKLEYTCASATVTTTGGQSYTFDLVVGADGIRSTIRSQLFPEVNAKACSKVAAYRGVLAMSDILAKIPEAKSILNNTMDMWTGPEGYIMTYPLSGGSELNVVTSFCKDYYVSQMEEVNIDEFRSYYKDYSPTIQKIIEMVAYTQRWPLLTMPPMESWSNETKNVVLLGDACHCMQNHTGQGAATAIESAVFLARVLSEVRRGTLTLAESIGIYERKRMPRAWMKQQASHVSGELNMASDASDISRRDKSSAPEIEGTEDASAHGEGGSAHETRDIPFPDLPPAYRSWQLFASADSVPSIFYYDAEADADFAVCEFLQERDRKEGRIDPVTMVSDRLREKWWGAVDFNGV